MTGVVVAGALANKPGNGGEAWVRLTWLLGFAELGLDVHFVETAGVRPGSPEVGWFEDVVGWAGLTGRASLLGVRGESLVGPGTGHLHDLADDGALLVDISGSLRDPALVRRFRSRVYVDVDPGWTQLWHSSGLLGDTLARYDHHLTVGDAVPRCGLPLHGIDWRPVRPPVLLSAWPAVPRPQEAALTTVGSWRSPFGTVEHRGQVLGGKVREWRRLAGLPALVPQDCTAVLSSWREDARDRELLEAGGWRLLDPAEVAHPKAYRDFVQGSAGELSPAQGVYVGTGCGWTSDRTAGYLASGRPVVLQDTCFDDDLRASPAVLTFTTCEQAVQAARQLLQDADERSAAARALAESTFATSVVLPRVLELAGAR